jgi:hypothetical protein
MNFSKKEIKKIAEEIINIGFVVGLSLREIKPEKIITTSDDGQHKKKYTKWGELLLPGNLDESCEFFYEEASESYMKRFPDFKFNLDYASKLSDTLIEADAFSYYCYRTKKTYQINKNFLSYSFIGYGRGAAVELWDGDDELEKSRVPNDIVRYLEETQIILNECLGLKIHPSIYCFHY